MKHVILFVLFIFSFSPFANGQTHAGIKLGVSSFLLPEQLISMENEELKLTLKNEHYGLNGGVYFRLGGKQVALQPELIFNSNYVSFVLEDLNSSGVMRIVKERYNHLDLPVMVMLTPGIFRLYAGPVGHYTIQDFSEIKDWKGWKNVLNHMSLGYQAGGGIQFNGVSLDLRYEGRLLAENNKITIDGKEFELSRNSSRLLLTVGFKIL